MKSKKIKIKKVVNKVADYGFSDILHDHDLVHLLSYFKLRKHKHKNNNTPSSAELISLLTELGPGFVEFARIAASRSDLIPSQYQNNLLNLPYDLQSLERRSVISILRKELGKSISKEFIHIDESACHVNLLGGTYQAILQDGTRVLITVNSERSIKKFKLNLEQIEFLFDRSLLKLEKQKALIWKSVIDELKARSAMVLDLTNVGAKEEILSEQFKDSKKIIIPKVFWEYTTPNLLVQEYRNLPDWRDFLRLKEKSVSSKKYLVRYLLEAFAYQYAKGGHFLLRPRLSNWQIGEKNSIIFNNFLAIGYLEPEIREVFVEFLRAILESDANGASKALLKAHYELHNLEEHQNTGLSLKKIEGKTVSEKIWFTLESAWQGNLIIPLGISMAAESILYLENSLKKFDPEVDLRGSLLSALKTL